MTKKQDNWNFPRDPKTGKQRRGFAAMDPAKQRELASLGGKASHGGGAQYHKKPRRYHDLAPYAGKQ